MAKLDKMHHNKLVITTSPNDILGIDTHTHVRTHIQRSMAVADSIIVGRSGRVVNGHPEAPADPKNKPHHKFERALDVRKSFLANTEHSDQLRLAMKPTVNQQVYNVFMSRPLTI